jgi:hypothetical protein
LELSDFFLADELSPPELLESEPFDSDFELEPEPPSELLPEEDDAAASFEPDSDGAPESGLSPLDLRRP